MQLFNQKQIPAFAGMTWRYYMDYLSLRRLRLCGAFLSKQIRMSHDDYPDPVSPE
jgi:hypothetical protein